MVGLKFPNYHAKAAACRIACLTLAWLLVAGLWSSDADAEEHGQVTFQSLWATLLSDAYSELPNYPVRSQLFGKSGDRAANALRAAAYRTLRDRADLIDFPAGQKLFQPNGICFAGRWLSGGQSQYSGIFAPEREFDVVVRISVMLGDTDRGARRTLGMAVKLFVGSADQPGAQTVNLLVMDAVSGSRRAHVLDAVLDNHPDLGGLPPLGQIPQALRIRADLNAADAALSPAGPSVRYRDLLDLSAAGEADGAAIHSPHWLRLRADDRIPRQSQADFRDELDLSRYPKGRLVYHIELADRHPDGKADADWRPGGELRLVESVRSLSCDTRLHFAHSLLRRSP